MLLRTAFRGGRDTQEPLDILVFASNKTAFCPHQLCYPAATISLQLLSHKQQRTMNTREDPWVDLSLLLHIQEHSDLVVAIFSDLYSKCWRSNSCTRCMCMRTLKQAYLHQTYQKFLSNTLSDLLNASNSCVRVSLVTGPGFPKIVTTLHSAVATA